MKTLAKLIIGLGLVSGSLWAQCGVLAYNPLTNKFDCSGVGLPTGGTTGQLLSKNSDANYDYAWVTATGTGTVTSAGLVGTANQITVTGASPITASGSWTLTLPSGLIFPGAVTFHLGTTGGPSFNVPSGVAPTSPTSGDFWNLSGVLQFYNGATKSVAFLDSTMTGTWNGGIIPAAKGGTAVANTASLTLGSSNVNLATMSTGLVKVTTSTGALTTATSGTDYAPATSGTSILKASAGGFANAVSGTDYAPATTGTSILKASAGGFANATAGTDYVAATSGSAVQKASSGNLTAATAADVVALWASGSCTGYLKSDATCAVLLGDPGSNGIVKRTASGTTAIAAAGTDYVGATSGSAPQKGDGSGGLTAAAAADIYGLFTGTHDSAHCTAGDGTMQSCGTGGGGGITSITTGAGAPSSNCTAPSSSTLQKYYDTSNAQLWTCIAANTWNLDLMTSGVGTFTITGTTGTQPSAPIASTATCWMDSTSGFLKCIDPSSTLATMVVANTGATHQFLTAINAQGTVAKAQPSSADLSDVANLAFINTQNTFAAGDKQVFQPNGTTAGARVSAAALPATPATGDLAVDSGDSNKLKWYNGSGWQTAGAAGGSGCIPAGTSGQWLFDDGSGGCNSISTFVKNAQTTTYSATATDFSNYKTITVASGTFTLTLPSSVPTTGQSIRVINYGSGVVTVAPNGINLNGSTSNQTLLAGSAAFPTSMWILSDGTNYFGMTSNGSNIVATSNMLAGDGNGNGVSAGFTAANVVRKDAANTISAAGGIDMSAVAAGGLLLPFSTARITTDKTLYAAGSGTDNLVYSNGSTALNMAVAGTGTTTATTCTNQVISAISSVTGPTCHTIAAADLPAALANSTSINGITIPASITAGHFLYGSSSNTIGDMGTDFTFDTHTLTGGASSIFDLHSASVTGGFLPPSTAGAAPTTQGVCSFDTSGNNLVCGAGAGVTNHFAFMAASPSTGIAHIGSGNYTLTSSPIVAADITNNTITPSKLTSVERHFVITGSGTAGVMQATDDQPHVWSNHSGGNMTITNVWCSTDSANALTIQLQKDDGTPTNMLTGDLSCSSTEATTTAFVSGENVMADGTHLNYLTVGLGSSTATWVAIHYTVTY